ncbi:MAG: fructose-bisphosphatase class III [Parabacteroides johnsonii]
MEEEELMRRIKHSFECSEKLKKHMRCLFTHGSMYQGLQLQPALPRLRPDEPGRYAQVSPDRRYGI